jgi:alanyl-tRNA synthetase
MERQKSKGRDSWVVITKIDPVYRDLVSEMPKTRFLGYESDEGDGEVLALALGGRPCSALEAGVRGEVVLDQSPFYAEAGGQVGDIGTLVWDGGEAQVTGTLGRIPGYTFHQVEVRKGRLQVGMKCHAAVDAALRNRTRLNHTATHLLHAALRDVLGDHVKQGGSLVAPDRLRFDFTHFAPLDAAELESIEDLVNRKIRENLEVETLQMDLDEALKSGAMALFDQKYGDRVRVLRVGEFSTELCGGTHARRSGDIGVFKIVSDESVSAGIRRIEAVTGAGAVARFQQDERLLYELSQKLNVAGTQLPDRVEALVRQLRAQEKEIERLRTRLASGAAGSSERTVQVEGVPVVTRIVEELGGSSLRNLADELKAKLSSGVILLANRQPDKVDLVVTVTDDLVGRLDASAIVNAAAALLGGKGGGRKNFAQAGGKESQKLDEAIEAGIQRVRTLLGA